MATEYYDFVGKAKWAKLRADKPDEYSGDKRWVINLAIDDWKDFEKSGLQLKKKNDTELGDFVTFRRPTKKLIGDDLINFTAPIIIDSDKTWLRFYKNDADKIVTTWTKGRDPEPSMSGSEQLIPNGSTVSVRVAVYDTVKGKGHRMESVQIIDLAPMPDFDDEVPEGEEVKDEPAKQKGPKSPW